MCGKLANTTIEQNPIGRELEGEEGLAKRHQGGRQPYRSVPPGTFCLTDRWPYRSISSGSVSLGSACDSRAVFGGSPKTIFMVYLEVQSQIQRGRRTSHAGHETRVLPGLCEELRRLHERVVYQRVGILGWERRSPDGGGSCSARGRILAERHVQLLLPVLCVAARVGARGQEYCC